MSGNASPWRRFSARAGVHRGVRMHNTVQWYMLHVNQGFHTWSGYVQRRTAGRDRGTAVYPDDVADHNRLPSPSR